MRLIRVHAVAFTALLPALMLASFLLTGAPARANEIVFSDVGPTPLSTGGPAILGVDALAGASYSAAANTFTPSSDFTLASIDVALTWVSGTNRVIIDLDTSDTNGLPGQVLESWNIISLPAYDISGNTTNLTEVLSGSNVQLNAGQKYWVTVSPGDPTTDAYWNVNTSGYDDETAYSKGGVWYEELPDAIPGGFQISGIATGGHDVPEIDPSSASGALTILCGALLVIRGRSKKTRRL